MLTPRNLNKGIVYFPNLNALRFIAALLVVLHHIEQFKHLYHLPDHWDNPFIHVIGKLGVVLFFVLSGFLITYLLLTEQDTTGKINIKNFYIRRVLRIWPLYFFIIFLALAVLPQIPFFIVPGYEKSVLFTHLIAKVVLFVLILPNLVYVLLGVIPFASQTWSIGTEEQFYIIWPILMKYVKNKWVLMIGTIVLFLAVQFTLWQLHQFKYATLLSLILTTMPIDCMAIGGLYALIAYHTDNTTVLAIRKVLFNKVLQFIIFIGTAALIAFGVRFPMYHFEIYAVLFGFIIINLAANNNRIINIENKVFDYCGKISYGLYMYHSIAIVIVLRTLMWLNCLTDFLLYPLTIALTILFSGLSYKYLEKRFIGIKSRYTNVISGTKP
jgi:peptidoglycan/LPS O-acetylase OafA/YrhL